MKSIMTLLVALLTAALANATPVKEFVAGEDAPICASFKGQVAGLITADSWDWVCYGPSKVVGKNEKNSGYYIQFQGKTIEVGTQFLGEMISEARLPNMYGPAVKVGEDAPGCNSNATLSCKVEAMARVPDQTTYNTYSYYVKFEGQSLWFHHIWFGMDLTSRRLQALATAPK